MSDVAGAASNPSYVALRPRLRVLCAVAKVGTGDGKPGGFVQHVFKRAGEFGLNTGRLTFAGTTAHVPAPVSIVFGKP
jgi:hypothetical protein